MSEQNALQDLLVFAVKGVGYWADMARIVGANDEEVNKYLLEALAAIDKADANTLSSLAAKAPALQKQIRDQFEKMNGRAFSGFLPPAGKLLQITDDRAAQVAMGQQVDKGSRVSKEIAALRLDIMNNLKKVAASGKATEEVLSIVKQGLANIINDKMEQEDYDAYVKLLAGIL